MTTRRLAVLALLIGTGAVIHIFEGAVPRPLPWVRPGLANVVTLVTLELFGFGAAAVVAVCRILLASLLMGSFGNIAFAFSFTGGTLALLAMGTTLRYAVPPLSLVGVALTGAVAHAAGQLLVAWYFLVRSPAVAVLTPTVLLPAVLAGLIVGLIASAVCASLKPHSVAKA